jgi:hypothetical protein
MMMRRADRRLDPLRGAGFELISIQVVGRSLGKAESDLIPPWFSRLPGSLAARSY